MLGKLQSELPGARGMMVAAKAILIRNVRVIDGSGGPPLRGVTVLIEDGRFARVSKIDIQTPPGSTVIDGTDLTMLPGLIDMHGHLLSGGFDTLTQYIDSFDPETERRALSQMLYWGVTTVCNPVQPLETVVTLRSYVQENGLKTPRLLMSGPGFTAPGGWAGSLLPIARMEPETPEEAVENVDRLADAGVDFLKVYYDAQCCAFVSPLPRLKKPIMERIVDQAHKRELKVMVHAYDNENHLDALRAGADIMAHSAVTAAVDQEYIDRALENETLYLATLSVYRDAFDKTSLHEFIAQEFVQTSVRRETLDSLSDDGPLDGFLTSVKQQYLQGQLPTIQSNLRTVFESGVQVAAGPDTGVMGAFPGISVHREMELMVEAGLPAAEVLKATTSGAARFMGFKGLGLITEGGTADGVLVRGDPLTDIAATRGIVSVIKDGAAVEREDLRREFLKV
jgi:imidazolonepropionase-like amidohydrolase